MRAVALMLLLAVLVGCADRPEPPDEPTARPEPVEGVVEATTAPTDSPPPTATATAVADTATPTPRPESTEEAAPTDTPQLTPTDTPEPTATPPPTDTPQSTETAVPFGLAPGVPIAGQLEPGAFAVYEYEGTRFAPLFLVAEPDGDLDVALLAYADAVTLETDLDGLLPLAQADGAEAGLPEVMVFTPNNNKTYSLVVRNAGQAAGSYTLLPFEMGMASELVNVQDQASLEAGESRAYTVASGGRLLMAFANPDDRSDVQLTISRGGTAVSQADYGGPGSAEAIYILPRPDTGYTITVSGVDDIAAIYTVLIVALE